MLTSQGRESINGGLRTHKDDSIMYLVPDARHWLHPDRWTRVYTSSTNPRPLAINHKVVLKLMYALARITPASPRERERE